MGKRRQPAARSVMTTPLRDRPPSYSAGSAPSWGATAKHSLLIGASVLALVAASDVVIPPRPAYAVICQATGVTPNATANAVDGLQENTACGLNANAAGPGITSNSAFGSGANASGTAGRNTAIGTNASGAGSRNVATGEAANANSDANAPASQP
jgi:trimeric autotransporter adhesin